MAVARLSIHPSLACGGSTISQRIMVHTIVISVEQRSQQMIFLHPCFPRHVQHCGTRCTCARRAVSELDLSHGVAFALADRRAHRAGKSFLSRYDPEADAPRT